MKEFIYDFWLAIFNILIYFNFIENHSSCFAISNIITANMYTDTIHLFFKIWLSFSHKLGKRLYSDLIKLDLYNYTIYFYDLWRQYKNFHTLKVLLKKNFNLHLMMILSFESFWIVLSQCHIFMWTASKFCLSELIAFKSAKNRSTRLDKISILLTFYLNFYLK